MDRLPQVAVTDYMRLIAAVGWDEHDARRDHDRLLRLAARLRRLHRYSDPRQTA